jgi:error-prone DNA polymerase
MRVAIECAGFTPGEADQLRRAMATFKFTGGVSKFKDKLVDGMIERGYRREFAEKTFSQLEGFGSYGFPESHAASFALIAYASSWMKCWHPDVFCAALLNAQPMGFYAPAQIVRDARDHGVEIRPVCINGSRWDCTLEPVDDDRFAIRLGFRQVRGLSNKDGAEIVASRADRPFESVDDIWRRADVPVASLVQLAEADAMNESLGLARREALWALKALRDEPLELFAAAALRESRTIEEVREPTVSLRPMTSGGEVVEDYQHVGLTLRQHPASFLRADLASRRIVTCIDAMNARDGKWLTTAGLVLVRQKPGSAKGVMFITIEDETGVANLVIWPSLYERQRRIILAAGMIAVQGRIQREGDVVHLVANQLTDLSAELAGIGDRDIGFPLPHGRGDEFHHGSPGIDPRSLPPKGPKPRDIYVPDLHIDSVKVKTRDFR